MEPGRATLSRQVAFALLAAFIALGPAYRWAISGPSPAHMRWLRGWAMYTKRYDVCVARFVTLDGSVETVVDRYQALRAPSHGGDRRDVRLLKTPDEVRALGARICRAIGKSDVRAHARCSTLEGNGWEDRMRAEENLCR